MNRLKKLKQMKAEQQKLICAFRRYPQALAGNLSQSKVPRGLESTIGD